MKHKSPDGGPPLNILTSSSSTSSQQQQQQQQQQDNSYHYFSEGAQSTGGHNSNIATPSSSSGSPTLLSRPMSAHGVTGIAGAEKGLMEGIRERIEGGVEGGRGSGVEVGGAGGTNGGTAGENKLAKELGKLSSVDPNAVLRGMQLTLVGAYRALQNPALFASAHYKQALKAVLIGLAMRLILNIPLIVARIVLTLFSSVIDTTHLLHAIKFIEDWVLQLPLFVMGLMRHIAPTLDEVFMLSLQWADVGLVKKHILGRGTGSTKAFAAAVRKEEGARPGEVTVGKCGEGVYVLDGGKNRSEVHVTEEVGKRLFYPTLAALTPNPNPPLVTKKTITPASGRAREGPSPLKKFLLRSLKKAAISLTVYILTFLPSPIGPLVVPLSTYYSLHKFLGMAPAVVVSFLSFVILPKRTSILLLQAYFSSRHLVNDLLTPYFSRVPFSPKQKEKWFRDRQGVLFGFGVGFLVLLRVKLLGVLVYGIAEASTAYLVTKITEPVPVEALGGNASAAAGAKGGEARSGNWLGWDEWCEGQTVWRNKAHFLAMPVEIVELVTAVLGGGESKAPAVVGENGEVEVVDVDVGKEIPGGF